MSDGREKGRPSSEDSAGLSHFSFQGRGDSRAPPLSFYEPKRCLYSGEEMKALTISAVTKLPLNWLSFASQKL